MPSCIHKEIVTLPHSEASSLIIPADCIIAGNETSHRSLMYASGLISVFTLCIEIGS
jgi:hypothetical protein